MFTSTRMTPFMVFRSVLIGLLLFLVISMLIMVSTSATAAVEVPRELPEPNTIALISVALVAMGIRNVRKNRS